MYVYKYIYRYMYIREALGPPDEHLGFLFKVLDATAPGIQNLGGGPLHWRTEINMLMLG